MAELISDVAVIGGGIAGLWSAKELIDQGLKVDIIEQSNYLANGATTRNEGWLHAGTYHAAAIHNEDESRLVTSRTVYGHDQIISFAPESIEHKQSYAIFSDATLVQDALVRWNKFNIPYREVSKRQLENTGVDLNKVEEVFDVRDKSVNSRIIIKKLAQYILKNGGRVFTGADFIPTGRNTADIQVANETHKLTTEKFLVAAGIGTKQIFEDITGRPFPMRYFKSHLLVAPRLTADNIFYMDPLEAGIMSHGDVTIVGINREAVEIASPDCTPIPEKAELVRSALARLIPRLESVTISGKSLDIACIKVDISDSLLAQSSTDPTKVLQDLNIKVFEPVEGWVCAIPGKMTEAPALARAATNHIIGHHFNPTGRDTSRPVQSQQIQVSPRPADIWIEERYHL